MEQVLHSKATLLFYDMWKAQCCLGPPLSRENKTVTPTYSFWMLVFQSRPLLHSIPLSPSVGGAFNEENERPCSESPRVSLIFELDPSNFEICLWKLKTNDY